MIPLIAESESFLSWTKQISFLRIFIPAIEIKLEGSIKLDENRYAHYSWSSISINVPVLWDVSIKIDYISLISFHRLGMPGRELYINAIVLGRVLRKPVTVNPGLNVN